MISSRIKVCEILQGHKFKRNPGEVLTADWPKFSESSECCPATGQHTDDSENSCLCWVSWLAMRIKQSLFSAAKRSVSSLFGTWRECSAHCVGSDSAKVDVTPCLGLCRPVCRAGYTLCDSIFKREQGRTRGNKEEQVEQLFCSKLSSFWKIGSRKFATVNQLKIIKHGKIDSSIHQWDSSMR